jgi:hypothetical protein
LAKTGRAALHTTMSTFIVRIELHPSDKEQACSAVHDSMASAGFNRIYADYDGRRYHLPGSEYCITSERSAEAIRDLAAAATTKITSLFMLLVSDTTRIAIAGLVPVNEANTPFELSYTPAARPTWAFQRTSP